MKSNLDYSKQALLTLDASQLDHKFRGIGNDAIYLEEKLRKEILELSLPSKLSLSSRESRMAKMKLQEMSWINPMSKPVVDNELIKSILKNKKKLTTGKLNSRNDLVTYSQTLSHVMTDNQLNIDSYRFDESKSFLPVNNPLHVLMEEDNYISMLEMKYQSHDQKSISELDQSEVLLLEYCSPIMASELVSLSHFESPPPEIWITSRIVFYLIGLYYLANRKTYLLNASIVSSEGSGVVSPKHEVINIVLNESKKVRNDGLSLIDKTLFSKKEFQSSSEAASYILNSFNWKIFKQLLLYSDDLHLLLRDMESNTPIQLLDISKNLDTYLDDLESFKHDPVSHRRILSLNQEWHNLKRSDPIDYFKFVDFECLQILRDLTKPKTFHPSSSKHFSRACAHLCTWARRICGKMYRVSLNNASLPAEINPSLANSHHVEIMLSHDKDRHFHLSNHTVLGSSNLNFVLCIDDNFDRAHVCVAVVVSLAQSYEYVDVLISKNSQSSKQNVVDDMFDTNVNDSESKDIASHLGSSISNDNDNLSVDLLVSLKNAIQRLSSSPFHRVLDLTTTVINSSKIDNDFSEINSISNVVMTSASFKLAKELNNTNSFERDLSLSHTLNSSSSLSNIELTKLLSKKSSNYVDSKSILRHYKYTAQGDLLLLPMDLLFKGCEECVDSTIFITESKEFEHSRIMDDITSEVKANERDSVVSDQLTTNNTINSTIPHQSRLSSRKVKKLALITNKLNLPALPNKFIVCITNTPNSTAAFQVSLLL